METFYLAFASFLIASSSLSIAQSQPPPPAAIFTFGDSVADVGNNDYLPFSTAKADFLPNGIDYQNGTPTGRFSNGRTVGDILARSLGFPISKPYLSPATNGDVLLQGVNYASGGCGILNETNKDLLSLSLSLSLSLCIVIMPITEVLLCLPQIECLSLSTQLSYHGKTISKIIQQLGTAAQAQKFLSNSLYFVAIGSNDYLGNYIKSDSVDAQKHTPSQFNTLLTTSLGQALDRLYSQGARKIAVFGLGPIGCIPSQRTRHENGSCAEDVNSWVIGFNNNIKGLVQQLNLKLPDVRITFANVYEIMQRFIQQPSAYGFKVTTEACCGAGKLHAQVPCIPVLASVCSNRSDHLFWDPWHATEAANTLFANHFLTGPPEGISPWNIVQLAQQ